MTKNSVITAFSYSNSYYKNYGHKSKLLI